MSVSGVTAASRDGREARTVAPVGCTGTPGRCDAELLREWRALRAEYFPERPDLDEWTVTWSKRRQKRVLASCGIETKRVTVAREMTNPGAQAYLPALLYHELCHAALGRSVAPPGGRGRWHGREFRALEARHPGSSALSRWTAEGGWARAVRSERARAARRP